MEAAAEGTPADGETPAEAAPKTKKAFSLEKYDGVKNAFESSLSADAPTPPFSGDMENATYLSILQGLREFNPDLYVPPAQEEKPAE